MTAPANPILVAAVPTLVAGITLLKQAITTVLTGDPALLAARIEPAAAILDGQLTLLIPGLLNAEEAVGAAAATSGLDGIIAKLNALVPPATPAS